MRTYRKNGELWLSYRDSKLSAGPFYAASWIESGHTLVDLLCEGCKVTHADTYADCAIRPTVLASDEACSHCGSPEIDRPATLKELSNLF